MVKGKLQKREGRRRLRGGRGRGRRSTRDDLTNIMRSNLHRKTEKKLSRKFFIDKDGDYIALSETDSDILSDDGRKHRRHPYRKNQGAEWQSDKWCWNHSWGHKWQDNEWHQDKWYWSNHDWQQGCDSREGAEVMEDVVVEDDEVQENHISKKLEPEPVPTATAEATLKEEMISMKSDPESMSVTKSTKSLVLRIAHWNMCRRQSLAKPNPMQTQLIASRNCSASKVITSIPKPIPKCRIPKPILGVAGLQSEMTPKFVPKQGTFAHAPTHSVPAKFPMQSQLVAQSVHCVPKLHQVGVVPKGQKVPPPPKRKAAASAPRYDEVLRLRQQQISADLIAQQAATLAGGIFIPATQS